MWFLHTNNQHYFFSNSNRKKDKNCISVLPFHLLADIRRYKGRVEQFPICWYNQYNVTFWPSILASLTFKENVLNFLAHMMYICEHPAFKNHWRRTKMDGGKRGRAALWYSGFMFVKFEVSHLCQRFNHVFVSLCESTLAALKNIYWWLSDQN